MTDREGAFADAAPEASHDPIHDTCVKERVVPPEVADPRFIINIVVPVSVIARNQALIQAVFHRAIFRPVRVIMSDASTYHRHGINIALIPVIPCWTIGHQVTGGIPGMPPV